MLRNLLIRRALARFSVALVAASERACACAAVSASLWRKQVALLWRKQVALLWRKQVALLWRKQVALLWRSELKAFPQYDSL
jgi:hypothetical protein